MINPLPNEAEIFSRPELFFGLVGASGSRLNDLSDELKKNLIQFGYESIDIRLSDLLTNFADWKEPQSTGEFHRIAHLQEMGNAFRRELKDKSALVRAGITAIRAARATRTESSALPISACAYIIRQLKHPDEVDLLRQVYGSSFLLIAGHAPRESRVKSLAKRIAEDNNKPGEWDQYRSDAEKIVTIDEMEDDEYGQDTRDAYPKADFFVNLGEDQGEHRIYRFIDLVFGHPFHTPLPEEGAMYQAHAVSLKSSDENRQVGAAIVNVHVESNTIRNADVIAVGMNEVPRRGGGFYCDGDSPDPRDQSLAYRDEDRARQIKISALAELIGKIRDQSWLGPETQTKSSSDLAIQLLPHVKGTQFMNIGEFSRPVHAEMAALIDSARRGVSVHGHTMFVTTFPCHNCAKHIIAAGLQRVVYLEPYAKSRARTLYNEEIVIDPLDMKPNEMGKNGEVVFCAFTGVAPRQYQQLFSMSERGAHKGNSLKKWELERKHLSPLYVNRNAELAYLAAECQESSKLPTELYRWDRKSLCPD